LKMMKIFLKGTSVAMRFGSPKRSRRSRSLLRLTACDGGGDQVVPLQLGVLIAGQPQPAIFTGQAVSLCVLAGQSIKTIDLTQVAQWTWPSADRGASRIDAKAATPSGGAI
jgi:hypothetical protein